MKAATGLAAIALLVGCGGDDAVMLDFTVVTFNTGTTEGLAHDDPPDDGYTSQHATYSDLHYGDGLAWTPAISAATAFFTEVSPDLIGFQEIFYSEECAEIPAAARTDFVCESWSAGDPTVARLILGSGYQVMCHPGKSDKCVAIKKAFGNFRGCNDDFCLEGMEGYRVDGCGSGARVARATVDLVSGGSLTLVNYHGSSGLMDEDEQCRVAQIDQVFVDLGAGTPGVSGERNLVIGDLNTDPGRLALNDASARRWNDFVGQAHAFHFISAVGEDAPPSYQGILNIDHVMGDVIDGACWVAGLDDQPAVIDAVYFDHKPVVCPVTMEQP